MNLKLKDEQILNAILLVSVQNSIAIKTLAKTLLEYIAEKDGDEKADKFETILNAFSVETQDEVLAHLKSVFGDIDDIDLNDLLKP